MDVSKFIIYALVDPRYNAIRYIGKSSRGLSRARYHFTGFALEHDPNQHKCNWIKELSAAGLTPEIRIVEQFDSPEQLDRWERFWISVFRQDGCSLLNLTEGGDGQGGTKRSKEAIERTRRANTGKKRTFEQRERISLAKLGNKAFLGKKHSIETRSRLSLARGGRPFKDEHGNVYRTVREAGQMLGVNSSHVSKVLRGIFSQTGGHTFVYVDKENNK
jgi:hypothetical protein